SYVLLRLNRRLQTESTAPMKGGVREHGSEVPPFPAQLAAIGELLFQERRTIGLGEREKPFSFGETRQ
ncbi:MAG: hypothetical protein MZV49_00175, partial [Rhodopseudomonas palustris]|nr:hypothetical protein [Rhodopseudomonas palustris]